ncbi:MAG: hypothetical protein JWR68_1148 [Polaromonas sp.]|nr:hypothetical protein [Polaromonas sp.]
MERKPRVALLIDADNSPASKIDLILNELSTFGETNIRRAYGNWKKSELKGWEEVLHEHAIRPMQQFDYTKGKNASDMAMVIDALELLYTDRPDAFGIVSSDADFTPLVMHLRAKGAAVYGFGAQKTPEPFVNACSRFLYMERLGAGDGSEMVQAEPALASTPTPGILGTATTSVVPSPVKTAQALRVPAEELKKDLKLVSLLRGAVIACEDEGGWSKVGAVRAHIGNKASFDSRNYGYATLSKLLTATGAFELRDEGTPKVNVRDKRHHLSFISK